MPHCGCFVRGPDECHGASLLRLELRTEVVLLFIIRGG